MTTTKALRPLQNEVIETIQKRLDEINKKQLQIYHKRMEREQKKPKEQQKDVIANLFITPTKEKPYISYSLMDALFKTYSTKGLSFLTNTMQPSDYESRISKLEIILRHLKRLSSPPY